MPTQGTSQATTQHTYRLVLNKAELVEVENPDNFWMGVKVGDQVQFITPITGATVKVVFNGTGLSPLQVKTIEGTDFHEVVNDTLNPLQWMATTSITTPDGKEHECQGSGHGPCSGCPPTGSPTK